MKIPHSYHNTTGERGDDLARYETKASTQEDRILEYFRRNWHTSISPSRVQRYVMPGAPLTSVRRAITNLAKRGRLVKTDRKVDGPYGRPEHCWRYAGARQTEMQL